MSLRLLGPVEVWAGPTKIPAGPPLQCVVLAALAVDAGRVVAVESLVDRVWGEAPPEYARRNLHTHVARVRAVVGQVRAAGGEPVRVVRRAGGYVLDVEPDQVDLHRFRRLVEEARSPVGGAERRMRLLREALGLWHGEPLAGLPGEWARRMRQSWRQERVDVAVAWADVELQVGDRQAVAGPITELAEEHPLVEPLAAVLMRALAAGGRTAEALSVYAGMRARLARDLRTEPGPELRAVHQSVLRGEVDQPAPARAASQRPVPAQLPADVSGFSGRRAELAHLVSLLDGVARPVAAPAAGDLGRATAVVISAVAGTAGVGKTALAVHWAHQVRDRFPDGQLYVNLRGFDPGGQVTTPAVAVRGFLDALGVPAERIPTDLDAQTALYRSLLDGKRVLVVLDNARDADHARPLLPGSPTALAVVTSRDQLSGLVAADGARPLTLGLLSTTDARELLAGRIDPDRMAAEPEAVEEIIARCARLPLALALVAARAAIHPTFPLAALAAELAAAGGGAGQLAVADVLAQVRAVFSWSYATLTPAAARLFRNLGLHPGPDISTAAAASLTGAAPVDTRRSLAELTRAGLLTEHTLGRYGFHDLLRAYAADLTQMVDSDDERRAAVTRLLDHYTHTAHTAAQLLYPARDPIGIPLAPPTGGAAPEQPADLRAALAWLTAEHPVLLAAQRFAAGAGFDIHTWQLAWALDTFLDRRGHWQDLSGAWQTALTATERFTHPTAAATAHRQLAYAARLLGDYGAAHAHLRHVLDLHTAAGDQVRQAHTHLHLGQLWERQDRPDRALDHTQQALALFRALDDSRGQAYALNNLGWEHALLGDPTRALTCCQQALTLHEKTGDRHGQAASWDSLGYAHHHLGDHTRAVDCYQHALTLYRDAGDRHEEANTLIHLGDTHHAVGQPDAARTAWTDALRILSDLDHPDAGTVRAKLTTLGPPPADRGDTVDEDTVDEDTVDEDQYRILR